VMGGAAVMKRSFTQPWPMPPGLVVARMHTEVPGPLGRLRENIKEYSSQVKCVRSSNTITANCRPGDVSRYAPRGRVPAAMVAPEGNVQRCSWALYLAAGKARP